MNTYYIHNGIETSGPYTIEELAQKNIKATTPIWCPGMPDSKIATEINSLKPLLLPNPPALSQVVMNSRTGIKLKPKKNNYLGLTKRMIYFFVFLFMLVIVTICFNLYHENRLKSIELVNYETEKQNIIFKQKQIDLEEKKIQIAIANQINKARAANERKKEIIKKLKSNKELTTTATNYLENAKNKLEKAEKFHVFRSQNQREEEINKAKIHCENWKRKITEIEYDNNLLKLEYEKLP